MSPDYSTTNSSEITCRWKIYSNHNLLHLKITYVDIGSCSHCCDSNYFKVSNEYQELARYCNNKEAQDVVLNESLILLDFRAKFYTSKNKGIRVEYNFAFKTCEENQFKCTGEDMCIEKQRKCNTVFDCKDHSDEVNCTYCPIGQAACDYISTFCFSPLRQRCDGVVDCPGAEDELNCFSDCPGKLRCGNTPHCYEKKQHCDRNFDCINGYDEKNCSHLSCGGPFNIKVHFICRNGRCIDRSYLNDGLDDCGDGSDEFAGKNTNYIVLATFIGIFMSVIFIFLVCRWFLTRRNINYLMANPPEFPRRRRGSSNDYNENDFRRGGAIFEAYLQSRIERERRRKASNDSKSKTDAIFRTRNHCQLVVAPREAASAVETKRNVDSQANLERLVFENFVQKKNLSDSSDFSPPSGDDLSLGEGFSPKLLMEAHEEKCLLCKSQNIGNNVVVNSSNTLEVRSNVYLMDKLCEHNTTFSKYCLYFLESIAFHVPRLNFSSETTFIPPFTGCSDDQIGKQIVIFSKLEPGY
ncbi:hypothetical protein Trydic_g15904 [Trypoxylus dichotomus]